MEINMLVMLADAWEWADDAALVRHGHQYSARVQSVYGAHCLPLHLGKHSMCQLAEACQKNKAHGAVACCSPAELLLGLTDWGGLPAGKNWNGSSTPAEGI